MIFTAHWDHLGIGPAVNGDSIYNGAVDNATGCAMIIEMARAWAALEHKPKRSAIFMAVTAEEAGLRGSEYYAAHPVLPLAKTALDLNFDAFPPFGRTKDVSVTGAERTTVWPVVEEAARRMELTIKPDAHPEQGHFYRSDHFSLAHAGVPAFSIDLGTDYYGKPAGYGDKDFRRVQRQALPSAVRRISRRLGFRRDGRSRAVRHPDRNDGGESDATADLARRRRISCRARKVMSRK